MSLTMFSYTCEYAPCGKTFQRRSAGRKYRYCCIPCAGFAKRKITTAMLAPHAERGTHTKQIAAELKISPTWIATAMRRHGLYKLWCQRRYLKCASPMVGPMLATTAFVKVITRSATSVPLKA